MNGAVVVIVIGVDALPPTMSTTVVELVDARTYASRGAPAETSYRDTTPHRVANGCAGATDDTGSVNRGLEVTDPPAPITIVPST